VSLSNLGTDHQKVYTPALIGQPVSTAQERERRIKEDPICNELATLGVGLGTVVRERAGDVDEGDATR